MIDNFEINDSSIGLVTSESILEKCTKLDVEVGLQLSVLSGMVTLNRSGAFLAEERTSASAGTQSMSLIYKLRTVNEEIVVREHKKKINQNVFKNNATHAVVAIDWGAVCSITCGYKTENEDVTVVRDALRKEVEKLRSLLEHTEPPYEKKDKIQGMELTFKFKTDFLELDGLNTIEDVLQFHQTLHDLVNGINSGKGVPVTYHLMSLETIVKKCRFPIKLDIPHTDIGETTVKKCAEALETFAEYRIALRDIQHNTQIDSQSTKNIDKLLRMFSLQERRLKADLQETVKGIRSAKSNATRSLDISQNRKETSAILTSEYNEAIAEFRKELANAREINTWQRKGITCIGKNDSLNVHGKCHIFVLYKTRDAKDGISCDTQNYFMRKQATHTADDEYEFLVVNEEIAQRSWPFDVKNTVIWEYGNGNRICTDVYKRDKAYIDFCLIEIGKNSQFQVHPKERAYVHVKCPKSPTCTDQDKDNTLTWRCSICKESVEYGIKTRMFYCKCGKSNPEDAKFLCNKCHDLKFAKYPSGALVQELSQHKAIKDYNILILGETGVGKSTWINGFQNYLCFDDLIEAMNSEEIHVLIPSAFSFTDDTASGEPKMIKIGKSDSNEGTETGKSATKAPRSYVFYVGGARIHLIDTPGIGDVEGIKNDKINIDNILSFLTHFEELHAVCILLKPDITRLTKAFTYCIQELLSQLHSSAKENIVFCFTYSRATFYRPGETLTVLNKMFDDKKAGMKATRENSFCFDSEAFRFLACIKNGIKFSQGDIDTFANSWNKSVEETQNLFKYISSKLTPHKVRDTLSMNEAKRIVTAMAKPLALVAQTIAQNVQAADEAKKKMLSADSDIRSIENDIKFSGYDIEFVDVPHPRTVCSHPDCVKHVSVGTEREKNKIYTVCHSDCYLIWSRFYPMFYFCECINYKGNCKTCTHPLRFHMHLTYETKLTQKQFLSAAAQEEIKQKGSFKAQQEDLKRKIKSKITELESEEKLLMQTAAKYSSFLKANAIISYNDSVEEYIDLCIHQEKTQEGASNLLSTLQKMKKEYEHERRYLDHVVGSKNIRTPSQVMATQEKLFKLEHFGPTLKDLFDGISIANSARNKAFAEKQASISMTKRLKSFFGFLEKSHTGATADASAMDSGATDSTHGRGESENIRHDHFGSIIAPSI